MLPSTCPELCGPFCAPYSFAVDDECKLLKRLCDRFVGQRPGQVTRRMSIAEFVSYVRFRTSGCRGQICVILVNQKLELIGPL